MEEDGSWLPWIAGAVLVGVVLSALFLPADMLDLRPDREDPVADAGPDQTVTYGQSVELDGSGSSDDKGIDSYQWTIVEGSNTVFKRGEKVNYLFGSPGQYEVTLTVTDRAGKEASDQVLITVLG
jgi:hypothetical protein